MEIEPPVHPPRDELWFTAPILYVIFLGNNCVVAELGFWEP